jgi:hypothetical protein
MGRFFICASSLSGCALSVFFSLIHFRMARVRGSLVLGYCNFSLFAIAAGFAPRSLSFTASLRMSESERPTPSSLPGRANLRSSSSKSFSSVSFFARARLRPAQRRQQASAPGFLRGLLPAHPYRNPFVPWLRFLTYSALCNGERHAAQKRSRELCICLPEQVYVTTATLKSTEPGVLGLCARHCESDGKANGRGKGTVFAAKPSSKRQK